MPMCFFVNPRLPPPPAGTGSNTGQEPTLTPKAARRIEGKPSRHSASTLNPYGQQHPPFQPHESLLLTKSVLARKRKGCLVKDPNLPFASTTCIKPPLVLDVGFLQAVQTKVR